MMHALTFTEDGAWYRNRYVRTPKYRKETAAGRIVCRSFGHNAPGGVLANMGRPPANAANTAISCHAGQLLALWEGGRPWALDPDTLDTLGECNFNGALGMADPFSAHGHTHPQTGYYYNHGVTLGPGGPRINLYELDPAGRLTRKRHFRIDRLAFVHGAGLSQRFMVLLVPPLGMSSVWPFVLGRSVFDRSVAYRPEWGMKAYLVSLETLTVAHTFELDPFVLFHYGNCREVGDELVVDLVRFEDYAAADQLRDIFGHSDACGGTPWQYRFNLRTGAVTGSPMPMLAGCEFPQFDERFRGQRSRFLYTAAIAANETPGFFNALQRLDTETGRVVLHDLGVGRFTSEAVFVPAGGGEGEGYLCAVVYDAGTHRSEVVLLDARSDTLAEVAAVPLRNPVPFGFHCAWRAGI